MVVRQTQGSSSRFNSSNRKPLHCSFCDLDHHVRETCWKLNGYPPGHPKNKSNRFNQGNNRSKPNNSQQSSANNVKEGPTVQEMQSVMSGLTDFQFQQILSIMNSKGTPQSANPKANAAGTSSGLSQAPLRLHRLIIDSGATDHITSSPNLLVDSAKNTFLPPVIMPSGEQAPITSTGTLPLNSDISLKNVLDDSLSITLLNPFYINGGSRCRGGMIRLPPIIVPPGFEFIRDIAEDEDEYISELSICKAVLSANPALAPDYYLVTAIYSFGKSLAFIKSGDKDWTYVGSRIYPDCEDVLYHNGTIYAVDGCGEILYCDTTVEPVPMLKEMAPAPPSTPLPHSRVNFHYMVESPHNQLLLVCRMMVSNANDNEPRYQTTGFKIFELFVLEEDDKTAWVELKTLGNHALFLGNNHSTCVSAASSNGFPRLQPNSIYFTDHALANYTCPSLIYADLTLRVPADMGVFNLEDQSLGQYYDLGDNLSNLVQIPPPVWFLPSFPGTWA
ncbi:hypothetical protein RHGRI_034847 [Rhododendron griersonianum]|uniref:KIB1-4 beta-propeller domain-containing protein n=1 Tax=Rhododendron griersonianum TaxID=479676 RepID=A0AAV6I646_9ERIC|nr:hypothetical protein RHGRI_034847 [Rhododendron griersonianum]